MPLRAGPCAPSSARRSRCQLRPTRTRLSSPGQQSGRHCCSSEDAGLGPSRAASSGARSSSRSLRPVVTRTSHRIRCAAVLHTQLPDSAAPESAVPDDAVPDDAPPGQQLSDNEPARPVNRDQGQSMPNRRPDREPELESGPEPARRAFPASGGPAPRHGPAWPPQDQSAPRRPPVDHGAPYWPPASEPHDPQLSRRRLRWPPDQSWWPGTELAARSDPGAAPSAPDSLDWLINSMDDAANPGGNRVFPNPDGAPAASMPGVAGRFAAEWCPTGTSSRENSLLRERGRTDGGVMVRRALLDRGDLLPADDEALPPSQPLSARPDQAAPHWRGAGGRWLVWVARAIAWAVILLIGYRGVVAIIDGRSSAPAASPPSAAAGTQFPVTLAEAYALQFGDVYLNFSPDSADQRSRELARFLPAGTDPQLGWNGAGTQRALGEQVAGVSVTGSHSAVVTLLARLSGGRLIELGVPIYAARGGMVVSGDPALLPGPAKVAPPAASQTQDQPTEAALTSQLPAFF